MNIVKEIAQNLNQTRIGQYYSDGKLISIYGIDNNIVYYLREGWFFDYKNKTYGEIETSIYVENDWDLLVGKNTKI